MTEIVVALLGLIGVLATTIYGKKKNKEMCHRADQAEKEVKFQRAALDFGSFVGEWSATHKEIEHLLETTPLDRFILLRAWNGPLAPKWTTAVYQMRLGEQEPISYVHFELDSDYVDKLKELSIRNTLSFSVDTMADTYIRSVYEAEGVKHAVWSHISSDVVEGGDSISHTYCSFATHEDEPLDPSIITRCSILAGRLKGIAMAFNNDK